MATTINDILQEIRLKATTELEKGLAMVGDSSQKTEYNSIISYEQYESE